VLKDYRTAPVDERLRAALGYLELVTLAPERVTADDARAALAKGVTPQALAQALNVAFVFNLVDRLADSLGWELPTQESFRRWGKFLLKNGYGR
jgi:alkylhydroperoxidase family enzyme